MRLFGIAGWSGCGKTTLMERLIPALAGEGWRVGVVKHAHHNFDTDLPGKDSYRFRQAGARAVLAGSSRRWALIRELGEREPEPDVWEQAGRLFAEGGCDLVLAEGFKRAAIPKLEVWRGELERPLLCAEGRECPGTGVGFAACGLAERFAGVFAGGYWGDCGVYFRAFWGRAGMRVKIRAQ